MLHLISLTVQTICLLYKEKMSHERTHHCLTPRSIWKWWSVWPSIHTYTHRSILILIFCNPEIVFNYFHDFKHFIFSIQFPKIIYKAHMSMFIYFMFTAAFQSLYCENNTIVHASFLPPIQFLFEIQTKIG